MPQMRSRREQVDAHRFITSRMNQALVLANPDSVERPLRRIGLSIFASVMIMVLVMGGFMIAALLGKGNDAPKPGHIIFERDTGAIYVYTAKEGVDGEPEELRLWPVANYTSALLLLKPYEGEPPTQHLKPSSLTNLPRGFPLGIDGAPFSPPDPDSLLQDEHWNACSMPRREGSVDKHVITQLVVQNMPEPTWLGDDQWLLARTAGVGVEDSTLYLLWNDLKFEIPDETVLNSLNLNRSDSVPLTTDMLNTITPGANLEAETEEYFGTESGVEDDEGRDIPYGRTVEAGGERFVLLRQDGEPEFARVSETEAVLLAAAMGHDTISIQASTKNDTGAQAFYGHDDFPDDLMYEQLWKVDTRRPAVCGVFDPTAPKDDAKVAIGMYRSAPEVLTQAANGVELAEDGTIISNVDGLTSQTVLPPGTAALVSAQSSPGQTVASSSYLVDSLGYRFGLVDKGTTGSTKALLGYGDVDTVGVPLVMLNLIPESAKLDPTEALKQLTPESDDISVFDTGEDEEDEEDGGE